MILHEKLSSVPCSDLNGKEIYRRVDTCVCRADSFFCTLETNNLINQLYSNKNFKKIKYLLIVQVKRIKQVTN